MKTDLLSENQEILSEFRQILAENQSIQAKGSEILSKLTPILAKRHLPGNNDTIITMKYGVTKNQKGQFGNLIILVTELPFLKILS